MGILLLAVMGACGRQERNRAEPTADPAPLRIVSLTPALTEILFALDLGERIVGVTTFCDYPPEARRKPKVGGYVNPSVEAVLALRPDLVVVSPAAGNRDAALAMRAAGLRVEVVEEADTLEETCAAIERAGAVAGVPERGREVARRLRARVEDLSRVATARPPVRALFCLQTDPIVAAGPDTLPGELLRLAGGRNVVTQGRYPRLGIESVLEMAPEVVIHAGMGGPGGRGDRAARDYWDRWPAIPAAASGRVHVIDAAPTLRPGPRVAEAVETLGRLLHPAPPGGRRP